jgi:phosphotriesterase-related protein
MSDVFLPALRTSGISDATIRKLTVENPADAFSIRLRP